MDTVLIRILRLIMSVGSDAMRLAITNALDTLETQATQTPNEWDDLLVVILKKLLIHE